MLLTSFTATFLLFATPYKEGKLRRSMLLRKQESFSIGNGALICRNASAKPPLCVAHCCTMIALKSHTGNAAFLLCTELLRVSDRLVIPPTPTTNPSLQRRQRAGHTHFPAHIRSSSDIQGAVIYGARSFSVHAGNSNTHGRTEGLKGEGRSLSFHDIHTSCFFFY